MNKNAKKLVIKSCTFVSLGGLLFGLDQGFINGSLNFIREEMGLTANSAEVFAGIMLIGCIAGVLISGWASRKLGRKKTLIFAALFFAFFTFTGSLTHNIIYLFSSRFALGLAVGCASFAVPLYLSEIAPVNLRGGFIAMYQLMIALGIFLIYFSNSIIAVYFESWRIMLGIIAIPSVIMLLGIIKIPRSPRWLVLKGKDNEAKDVLTCIRDTEDMVNKELTEIKESIVDTTKVSCGKILREKYFIKVLFLGISLMILQQFSGINSVIYYSSDIFEKAGFSNPGIATVVMGFINVFVTIISIKYVDKLGRKPILYFGYTVMTLTLLTIAILFKIQEAGIVLSYPFKIVLLVSCLVYVASFAVSLGPIMWIVCAEIFPLEGRDLGLTASTTAIWAGCWFVVQFSLTIMRNFGGSSLFFIFTFFCIIGLIVVYFFTPETKGVSLEEIENNLKNGAKLRDLGIRRK